MKTKQTVALLLVLVLLMTPWAMSSTITSSLSGGGGGTPGGSTTQIQYNNAGAFGGVSGATTDGTVVTLTNAIVGTQSVADSSTKAASTAFVAANSVARSETNTIASWTVQNSAGLTTGVEPIVLQVPSGRTITGWALQSDQGTVTVDILKQAYAAGTVPSVSVVGTGTKPAIASGTANKGTVGDWSGSLTVTTNDQMSFQITAVGGGMTNMVVQIFGTH